MKKVLFIFLVLIVSCKDYKKEFQSEKQKNFILQKRIDSLNKLVMDKDSLIRQANNYINVMEY